MTVKQLLSRRGVVFAQAGERLTFPAGPSHDQEFKESLEQTTCASAFTPRETSAAWR